MRTRLYGGVGGSAAKAAPYPDFYKMLFGEIKAEVVG